MRSKDCVRHAATLLAAGVALLLSANAAPAKELKSIGVSLATVDESYSYFYAVFKGVEFEAMKINPNVKIATAEHLFRPTKQNAQIDDFIAAGVDLIVLNPSDANAIAPAIARAHQAGIPVVAVDHRAAGVDATVETNNVQAGMVACEYLIEKMGGKGAMLILSSMYGDPTDRVQGCTDAVAKHPGVKILSQDENNVGERMTAIFVGKTLLGQFPEVDGAFAVSDAIGFGTEDAAAQANRTNFPIVAVGGSPEAAQALKDPNMPQFVGTASQNPFLMARLAVQAGAKILDGQKPDRDEVLMDSKMVTRDNVNDYEGWTAK